MNIYLIVALILALYMALAWVVGVLLRLQGSTFWLFWSCLAVIGVAAAASFLWFHRRLQRKQAGDGESGPVTPDDIKALLQRAEHKLRTSKHPGSLDSFPVVFILGETGSAKTSTMVHSGLDPELLAGQVFQDSDVVPTSVINVWFARDTIFIEAGGRIASDARLWGQLLRHTRPGSFSAAVGKGRQAARAVVLCFECERLASAQSSARALGNRLKEMAESLGAAFPVYVVFTKLDRIKNFADFVGNFTSEESAQPLGATFPRVAADGVSADQESARLSRAFDQIIYSLAEKRLDYLRRDSGGERLPGIYEFPREMKRLRNLAVGFLVEVARPAQLSATPFLRGFYLTGVRAIIKNEAVSLSPGAQTRVALPSEATRIFGVGDVTPAPDAPSRAVQSQKVPEWCFLPYLFTEIIVRDRTAFAGSRQSTRVSRLRRWMLGAAAVFFLLYSVALLVSFFNNRALELEVRRTAAGLAAASGGMPEVADRNQLQQLEQLRLSLARLDGYENNGRPLGYRFGLYSGDRVLTEGSRIYFAHFRRLLLTPTQEVILKRLRNLPSTAPPSEGYGDDYDSLKAYLMTTLRADKSAANFLAPVLLDRWQRGRGVDLERIALARSQFEYYAGRLQRGNMYPADADTAAIAQAREYLKRSQESDRVYQRLIAEAGKNTPDIDFNRTFFGTVSVVSDGVVVPGAFTKEGFRYVQEAVRNPGKFFGGEDWVLDDRGTSAASAGQLMQALKARYEEDYRKRWLSFVNAARVGPYASLQDAKGKLQTISGNTSPLLQLFQLISQNTSVDSMAIAGEFQPAQFVMTGATREKLIGPNNQSYTTALQALQGSVTTVSLSFPNGAPDQASAAPVIQAAAAATGVVVQTAQGFQIANQAHQAVQKLMEAPITSTEALVKGTEAAALNAAGQALCSQFSGIAAKYPFNSGGSSEATFDDLKFFQPGSGPLWSFYEARLKNVLTRQGNQFFVSASATTKVSPAFLVYLHNAAVFSEEMFSQGGQRGLRFNFTVRQTANRNISRLELSIDGKSLSGAGDKERSEKFEWPGEGSRGVHLSVERASGPFTRDWGGQWGVFRFFRAANRWRSTGTGTVFEFPLETRFANEKIGEGIVLNYEVEGQAGEVFRNEFFQNLRCLPIGAH